MLKRKRSGLSPLLCRWGFHDWRKLDNLTNEGYCARCLKDWVWDGPPSNKEQKTRRELWLESDKAYKESPGVPPTSE